MGLEGKDFKTFHCLLLMICSGFVFCHSSVFLLQKFTPVLLEGHKQGTTCAALGLLMSSAVVGETLDLEPSLLLVRSNCLFILFVYLFNIAVYMFSLTKSATITCYF